jgi:hypothetical protein
MKAFPSRSSSQISKSKIENPKCRMLSLSALALVAVSTLVSAQQPKKMPRVGLPERVLGFRSIGADKRLPSGAPRPRLC